MEFVGQEKERLKLGNKIALSLMAFVLSFKRSYRAFDCSLRSRRPGENRGPGILAVLEESGSRPIRQALRDPQGPEGLSPE